MSPLRRLPSSYALAAIGLVIVIVAIVVIASGTTPGSKGSQHGPPIDTTEIEGAVNLARSQLYSEKSGFASEPKLREVIGGRFDQVEVRRLAADAVEFCKDEKPVTCTIVLQPSGRQAFIVSPSVTEARRLGKEQLANLRQAKVPPTTEAPKSAKGAKQKTKTNAG
jgi:hypothetical protein